MIQFHEGKLCKNMLLNSLKGKNMIVDKCPLFVKIEGRELALFFGFVCLGSALGTLTAMLFSSLVVYIFSVATFEGFVLTIFAASAVFALFSVFYRLSRF